jgi:hypothetical protein
MVMMTFEHLGRTMRLGLISFPSFRSNKRLMLMLWREISVGVFEVEVSSAHGDVRHEGGEVKFKNPFLKMRSLKKDYLT